MGVSFQRETPGVKGMLELAIRNARVVDGTGQPAFAASIGVSDGEIVDVGDGVGAAHREIDAEERLVTPGFVDIHTNYDGQV
jgi:N-acyl-D-aspartate/D-glutamate deacylase